MTFAAVFNFRDLGGVAAADGRVVRAGRLFRSDSLSRLTEPDREAFLALGIRTVIDLRRAGEIERDGIAPAWNGMRRVHIAPEHPLWDHTAYDEAAGPTRFLADRYAELADAGAVGLAHAVNLIADADAAPVVVHCVAGKDRTGVVTALTLALLGVADADIAADYALTQENEPRFAAWLKRTDPVAAATPPPIFYTVTPPEAMLLFLDELRSRHGSVEQYLTAAGLDPSSISALRSHLLT